MDVGVCYICSCEHLKSETRDYLSADCIFWDVTLSRWISSSRRFEGSWCLHLLGHLRAGRRRHLIPLERQAQITH